MKLCINIFHTFLCFNKKFRVSSSHHLCTLCSATILFNRNRNQNGRSLKLASYFHMVSKIRQCGFDVVGEFNISDTADGIIGPTGIYCDFLRI